MPMPKEIGHQTKFPNTLKGLFLKGCWEIPHIMASSGMALIGVCLAVIGVHNYTKNDGENAEYKMIYMIVRPDNPKALRFKNPVHTEYKC